MQGLMEELMLGDAPKHHEKKAKQDGDDGAVIDFWAWTNHTMIQATTEAVYGPGNPFREKDFEDAWK